MANPLWSKPGTKHLDLSRGGGDSKTMEYLLVVSLGIVILGSIVFFIVSLTGGGGTGVSGAKDMHFECTAEIGETAKVCGHQFIKSFEELNKERPQVMAEEMEGGTIRLDCPKCGAKRSALPMVACPKCKKHFLLASTKMLADMQDNIGEAGDQRPDLSTAEDVCPHCKQNRIEWYREQYKKKKKNKK